MLISIVIPVYNGFYTIQRLVDELISTYSKNTTLDIVLVDDCSQDDSREVCQRLFEKYPGIVQFLALSMNVGEHNCVMAGLNYSRGEYVVVMDDDFQNPISEVDKLIQEIQRGKFDVVYSAYQKKQHSFFRNLGSWFNDKVANIILKKPKNLYLSSFKIMNRFTVKEIIKYDLPFAYIDGLILRVTSRIGKVTVSHDKRMRGESGYTLKKLVSLWLNTLTSFSVYPLRVATLLGVFVSFIGISFGLLMIVEKILKPEIPVGWASLIVCVCVFSGVQLLAIGLLGEYMGRIFMFLGKKPQFLVRKAFSKNAGFSEGE